nr:gustatory receptor [Semanotus bifasciatus]
MAQKELDFEFRKPSKFSLYKGAFLYQETGDMKRLKKLLTYGRYVGLVSFCLHGKSCIKTLMFLLLIVQVGYGYFSLNYIISQTHRRVTHNIIACIKAVANLFFVAICLVNSNLFTVKSWKLFFTILNQIEELRAIRQLDLRMNKKMCTFYCEIFLTYFLSLSAVYCYRYYLYISDKSYVGALKALLQLALDFYIISIMLIVYNVSKVVRNRLIFVRQEIRNASNSEVLNETSAFKLSNLMSLYGLLYALVESFNQLFGWHMFFFIANPALHVIYAIDNLLDCSLEGLPSYFFLRVYQFSFYLVMVLILVSSCDSVKKNANQVIRTCYLLHSTVESIIIRDQLQQLAVYAENWSLSFSAAGFYNIDQSTFPGLFNVILTYTVISIQFNLALTL